jgi:hypothetical protein
MIEGVASPAPEMPACQPTIFYANTANRQFFKKTSPTTGTYLECWVSGRAFAHVLITQEYNSPSQLMEWMDSKQLVPSTQGVFDDYFFQLCRELEAKRAIKAECRKHAFDQQH